MFRAALFSLILACPLLAPGIAHAQMEQQELVDRATLAAQDMLNDRDGTQAQSVMRHARAAIICPQVFHVGFIFGGQAGGCVLVARDGSGSWSYPAFYSMGAGSFGFQAGIQDAEVMMLIMNDRGLTAVIDDQFKLGADASVAFVSLGGGVGGGTTGAVGADIVVFEKTRGLFAGISLSGSLIDARSGWNQIYYGQPYATQQIVMQMQARNPAADPLRSVMTRYSGGGPRYQPAAAPVNDQGPAGFEPAPPGEAQPLSPVQQQSLPPPRR